MATIFYDHDFSIEIVGLVLYFFILEAVLILHCMLCRS